MEPFLATLNAYSLVSKLERLLTCECRGLEGVDDTPPPLCRRGDGATREEGVKLRGPVGVEVLS